MAASSPADNDERLTPTAELPKASETIKNAIAKLEDIRMEDRIDCEEFRERLRKVLNEELVLFRKELSEEMREANRVFLKNFREQTDRILLQSAKSAAIRTKEFVERTMTTIREAEEDGDR